AYQSFYERLGLTTYEPPGDCRNSWLVIAARNSSNWRILLLTGRVLPICKHPAQGGLKILGVLMKVMECRRFGLTETIDLLSRIDKEVGKDDAKQLSYMKRKQL